MKVDDSNRDDFEEAGMPPFQPFPDKAMTMPYYEVPADALESRELLARWAQKALTAAARKGKR